MNMEVIEPDPDSSPEKSLWCAVIGCLINDYRDGKESLEKVESWLNSDWGKTVCDMAGVEPDYIHRKMFVERKITQDVWYDKLFTMKCRLERDICIAKDGIHAQTKEVIKAMENQLEGVVKNMKIIEQENIERRYKQKRVH